MKNRSIDVATSQASKDPKLVPRSESLVHIKSDRGYRLRLIKSMYWLKLSNLSGSGIASWSDVRVDKAVSTLLEALNKN